MELRQRVDNKVIVDNKFVVEESIVIGSLVLVSKGGGRRGKSSRGRTRRGQEAVVQQQKKSWAALLEVGEDLGRLQGVRTRRAKLQLKEEEKGVGITFQEESASEEGIAQKEEVIFQLFLFKEGIVVQQGKVIEVVIKSF